MPTTPNGFWYPDRYDTVNSISGLFAQQAASADAALNNRVLKDGVPKFSSPIERDAAFSTYPPVVGALVYLQSTDTYEKWTGTIWETVIGEGAVNAPRLASSSSSPNTQLGPAAVTVTSLLTVSGLRSGQRIHAFCTSRYNLTGQGVQTVSVTPETISNASKLLVEALDERFPPGAGDVFTPIRTTQQVFEASADGDVVLGYRCRIGLGAPNVVIQTVQLTAHVFPL